MALTPAQLQRMFRSEEYQAMLSKYREDMARLGREHLAYFERAADGSKNVTNSAQELGQMGDSTCLPD